MNFKPGDIILDRPEVTLLVLEVKPERQMFAAFILNHWKKDFIGGTCYIDYSKSIYYTRLQDTNLNEI